MTLERRDGYQAIFRHDRRAGQDHRRSEERCVASEGRARTLPPEHGRKLPAEWNHRMVNNMKRRKQKAPTRPSPPRARRLTRPRKRSAAMKRSGEWRSSILTARSFAKL